MRHRFVGRYGMTAAAALFSCCFWCGAAAKASAQSTTVAAVRPAADVSRAVDTLLRRPVTIDVTRVPLKRAIDAAAASSNVLIQYRVQTIDAYPASITLHLTNVPLSVALDRLLSGTALRVTPDGGSRLMIVESNRGTASQGSGTVVGTVVDATTKRALRGAAVTLDASPRSVTTGDDGAFRIPNAPSGVHRVSVRMLGYVRQVVSVTVADGQQVTLEVRMEPSVNALDQIVVTGTVVSTELKAVPTAMTVITAKELEQRGITHIDQLFRGDIPGLFAQNQGSNSPLDDVIMFSRGATSLQNSVNTSTVSSNPIKTYVDGIEMADPKYLSQIDPRSIERIEILTGPQASTIYGSNAINGVMQIFTKRGTTGTASRPQLTATLLGGLVQNNFTTALAPQHDDAVQVTGTEGRWSYQAGGTWTYTGAWSPGKRTGRVSGFGGGRMQAGPLTVDGSLRLSQTKNRADGYAAQLVTILRSSGVNAPSQTNGRSAPTTSTLTGQTMGLTVGYAPTRWWSHELVMGTDASTVGTLRLRPIYTSATDSLLLVSQQQQTRTSLRYATTANLALASMTRAVITVGADQWTSLLSSMSAAPLSLTGTLASPESPVRRPEHNTGAFLQGQIGFWDALFLTYGLRAEWNPNYGEAANPNFSPRYGMAYTRDFTTPFGAVTTKLRASYGKSTRPPTPTQRIAQTSINDEWFGTYTWQLANPELGPEFQQGGEGGLELYFGNRVSLVGTRYNQTVDGLIAQPKVDSIIGIKAYSWGEYPYTAQYQNLNIGSIRNQGWELQGTVNTGPLTTRGTYSWTKSRVLGITPRYRTLLSGSGYQPGMSFSFLPEHTWSTVFTYTRAASMLSFNLNGTGFMYRLRDDFYEQMSPSRRLKIMAPRTSDPRLRGVARGYTTADLNATHRFTTTVEGVLQIQNLTDLYKDDVGNYAASMGRQTKAGFRVRW